MSVDQLNHTFAGSCPVGDLPHFGPLVELERDRRMPQLIRQVRVEVEPTATNLQ